MSVEVDPKASLSKTLSKIKMGAMETLEDMEEGKGRFKSLQFRKVQGSKGNAQTGHRHDIENIEK